MKQPGVGTNRYSYSFNDPVNKLDPNGNAFVDHHMSQEESDRHNEEMHDRWTREARELRDSWGIFSELMARELDRRAEEALGSVGMSQEARVALDYGQAFASEMLRGLPLASAARPASVWPLPPTVRGRAVEARHGANITVTNYPVIDDFRRGHATSIKSIDLNARSHQNIHALERTLVGHVNSLANFRGAIRTDRATGREYDTTGTAIQSRELVVYTQRGVGTEAQWATMTGVQSWAGRVGVTVSYRAID